MAEEVRRKLGEVQARLAEQSIYLRDLETRLSEVEEAVGVLVIPRIGRSSPHRSSPHEYIVEVSPAYGEPTKITLTARSDKQAIEKAKEKARYPIPATAKILSKVEVEPTAREKAFEELRLVAKVKPRKIEGASNPIMPHVRIELEHLTCPWCGHSAVYPVYYWNKSRLTDIFKCYACDELFLLTKEASNPSRWVLEMYPLDVLAWRSSLIELAGKPLTPSEYRLVNDYNNYLHRKGYLTSRQIEVLGEIARRHDVALPAIPEMVT